MGKKRQVAKMAGVIVMGGRDNSVRNVKTFGLDASVIVDDSTRAVIDGIEGHRDLPERDSPSAALASAQAPDDFGWWRRVGKKVKEKSPDWAVDTLTAAAAALAAKFGFDK